MNVKHGCLNMKFAIFKPIILKINMASTEKYLFCKFHQFAQSYITNVKLYKDLINLSISMQMLTILATFWTMNTVVCKVNLLKTLEIEYNYWKIYGIKRNYITNVNFTHIWEKLKFQCKGKLFVLILDVKHGCLKI